MKNTSKRFGILLILTAITAVMTGAAYAHDSSSGCGLGWEVAQKESLLSSSIRTTTNTILPNTFSMTTGSSGCGKHTIVKNDEGAVIYAVNNAPSLVAEMASGSGETLDGFAVSLGCTGEARESFGTFVQAHFEDIRTASLQSGGHNDGISLYRAVRAQLQGATTFRHSCVPSNSII